MLYEHGNFRDRTIQLQMALDVHLGGAVVQLVKACDTQDMISNPTEVTESNVLILSNVSYSLLTCSSHHATNGGPMYWGSNP